MGRPDSDLLGWNSISEMESSDDEAARPTEKYSQRKGRLETAPRPPTKAKREMKLEKFDGSVRIESFLAKFEICSRHNQWKEADRMDNLQCALTGEAAQILWDMGAEGVKTSKNLIRQLQARYGSANQTALYRTQLKFRRRQKGETLAELVNDVRRLIVLAYPGPSSSMKEALACEAFLEALNDKELAMKIREKEPPTLEEAYQFAMRLEAYAGGPGVAQKKDRKVHQARMVTEPSQNPETSYDRCAEFLRDWSQLQQANFQKLMGEIKSFFQRSENSPPALVSPSGPDPPTGQENRPRYGNGYRRRNNYPRRQPSAQTGCFNCGDVGHFVARCPHPMVRRDETEPKTRDTGDVPASVTNHIKGEKGAYLKVTIHGRKFHALLDTGSEVSLIPEYAVPRECVKVTEQELHAANGTDIEVLGEVNLRMKLGGLEIPLNCVVVRDVSEVLLGLDWMVKYVDKLDLKNKSIVVQGREFSLSKCPKKTTGRRVVCARTVIVPPRSEVNVVGRVIRNDLAAYEGDWVTILQKRDDAV